MTRKEFRERLNKLFPAPTGNPAVDGKGANNRYRPTKRAYGDYLWHQDRPMFENDYQEYLREAGR